VSKQPLPSLTLVDGSLRISPTQLHTMKTCMQMWAFKNVWRREANVTAPARDAGKALHAALEAGYKGQSVEQQREALAKGFRGLTLPDDEYRTEARYAEVLGKYREEFAGKEGFTTLGVEVPFAVELGEVRVVRYERVQEGPSERSMAITQDVPVILNGLIDRVLLWDNFTFIADTKTMNDWGDYKQLEWERAAQPKLYCWALSKLQAAHPELGLPSAAKGFMLDAIIIRKPTTSSRTTRPREEFKRIWYHYSPEQLEEAATNALGWVQAAVDQHAAGRFLMNEDVCAHHYGRKCPYWDVCSVPLEQREMVLGSDYYKDKVEREVGA
jgi:hypothetical protein